MTRSHAPRGYSLPLVILLAAILAAATFIYMERLQESSEVTGAMLKRRQAFYVADGISRAGSIIASKVLDPLPPPDAATEASPALLTAFLDGQRAQVQTAFDASAPSLAPTGFTVRSLTITGLGERTIGTLQNGPFKGMVAQLQPMVINDEVAHTALDTGAVASMSSSVVRGTLSMFQFFAFIDGYAYLYSGTGAGFAGRVHANGNVCMGSGDALLAERVTSAQRYFVARSSGCRHEVDYHESERSAYVATRPLTGIAELTATRCDNPGAGCVWVRAGTAGVDTPQFDSDGPGSGALIAAGTWRATNLARWNGMLQDSSNGVPHLGVPITGLPLVQLGRNASHAGVTTSADSNHAKSRFLVDPILAAEPSGVREQKFAFKSDIRVLNGIWYVRDTANASSIGTPIWSDHPGHYATRDSEDNWVDAGSRNVGQDDLATTLGWAPRPKRFSYYQTTTATASTIVMNTVIPAPSAATRPVVSYGSIQRDTSSGAPIWVPGYYDMARCSETWVAACGGTNTGNAIYAWPLQRASTVQQLLQGTRSGFRNGWGEVSSLRNDRSQTSNLNLAPNAALNMTTGNSPAHELWNVLPMNFDVAAFAAALADTTSGELGSYFTGAGRPFNGIIWMGSSWPGELQGMTNSPATAGLPVYWPESGKQKDCLTGATNCEPFRTAAVNLTQVTQEHGNTVGSSGDRNNEPFQQALPFNLCSDTSAGGVHEFETGGTTPYGTATSRFLVPSCARYAVSGGARQEPTNANQIQARVNAIRVVNGKDIDRTQFPSGLTISTNLPLYVVGDFNSTSTPSDSVGVLTAAANWRPALLAADTVHLQSNAWSDANEPWNVTCAAYADQDGGGSRSLRHATSTTYNMEVLAGWLESDNGNRDEVAYFTRLMENWEGSGVHRTIRGSIVIGFNSVFGFRFDWNGASNLDDNSGSSKVYGYDYNLDVPDRQPPGAPKFQVTAMRTFRRN